MERNASAEEMERVILSLPGRVALQTTARSQDQARGENHSPTHVVCLVTYFGLSVRRT